MHLDYKDKEVPTVNDNEPLPIWTVSSGPCVALENNANFDLSNFTENKIVTLNKNQYFKFKCYDQFGNEIDKGGENFTSNVKYHDEFGHISPIESSVIDNGDGNYYVRFIPESYGKHVVNLEIEVRNEPEKYGDEITLNLKPKECKNGETLCPNMDKCVSKFVDCIVPPNNCPTDKPFECIVNGQKSCVASQIQCDCPQGYVKCESVLSTPDNIIYWPGYCVPENARYMCPNSKYTSRKCKKTDLTYELSIDGKCRDPASGQPSQKVCPIGKVLCSDFSCRDSYDDCKVYDECPTNEVRCPDQKCAADYMYCPNVITCADANQVVCNDGNCYDNELMCPSSNVCEDIFPFLCGNNLCATSWDNCEHYVSCNHGLSLCSDNICRTECKN